MQENRWILCPICGNKTRDKIREDTVLENFPLFCPKCKQSPFVGSALFLSGNSGSENDGNPQKV